MFLPFRLLLPLLLALPLGKSGVIFTSEDFTQMMNASGIRKNKNSILGYTPPRLPSQPAAAITDTAVSAVPSSTPTMELAADELSVISNYRLSQTGNSSGISASLFPSSSACSVASGTNPWLLDSACCNHMTSDSSLFSHKSSSLSRPPIHIAHGTALHTTHIGDISTPSLSLSHTFLIPSLAHNLISLGQLIDHGCTIQLNSSGCIVQDAQTGKVVGIRCKVDRLFVPDHLHLPSTSVAAASTSSKALQLWHSRLGHASLSKLRPLVSSGQFGSITMST
ncbi:hypothetical protein RJ639_045961 [Escallonia herrerae]|uniref:GAG-pre-integrase domain-containing protein n=1 Tax=Escallonia herrerae TaxID=1293975 RepID=A0AA88W870_9ASTE|nr:hypothetical protein RJ639_045961 [Escallonia herrerae]